jgi:hypothetical protein
MLFFLSEDILELFEKIYSDDTWTMTLNLVPQAITQIADMMTWPIN